MCGITGVIALDHAPVSSKMLLKMTSALSHRGPDDEGYLFVNTRDGRYVIAGGEDTPSGVYSANFNYTPKIMVQTVGDNSYDFAFGHRRLSILDLSAAGHQPMSNDAGTAWIVHNGEIYNYLEIRDELKSKGYNFRTNTDTEVIIKAFEEWGADCLRMFNGMWAFCIWNAEKRELFCARDRLGIKPFYYYTDENMFAFASEIKALLQLGIATKPNDRLIYDFLKLRALDHTDETFFSNIRKLPNAHYLKLDLAGRLRLHRYWDIEVSDEIVSPRKDEQYAEELRELFIDAVKIRLRSDVPIGSCLSGGLDSSSIVMVANNLMFPDGKDVALERQMTFSACFDDRSVDERQYIEAVIEKSNAQKNYVFPTAAGFVNEMDNLLWHQEEPFAGTSIYSQWEVMKKAKETGVTVLLDGQGGDEQLAGYRKFYVFYLLELFKKRDYIRFLSESIRLFSSPAIIKDYLMLFNLGAATRYLDARNKMFGIDNLLCSAFSARYKDRKLSVGYNGNLCSMMKEDITTLSIPVLLRYEDRNSMAHAIETRLPFLDYRLVQALASFPLSQKMKSGWTKYVLRNALEGILPEKIRLRKSKLGFAVPEDRWFKKAIANHVAQTFDKALFIGDYSNRVRLVDSFHDYLAGKSSLYKSVVFFKFYILEHWGRKFFLGKGMSWPGIEGL